MVARLPSAGRLRAALQQRVGQRVVRTRAFGTVSVAKLKTIGYDQVGQATKGTGTFHFALVQHTIHLTPGNYTLTVQMLQPSGRVAGTSLPIVIEAMKTGSIVIVTGPH